MFKISLIQNLSEMRNYSYADMRQDLRELHFEVDAYTQENIDLFRSSLGSGDTDCVIFASNSLNDKKIYEYVTSPAFCESFAAYLDKGGACLVLHQHSLKNTENPFPFIDKSAKTIIPSYADETVKLKEPSDSVREYFSFPNKVLMSELCSNCKSAAVAGKYWQLLDYEKDSWSPILCDESDNALILRHSEKKVIFSSFLLDYQKHLTLLQNLIINTLSGNKALAILEDETTDTLGFNYFLNSLENKKLYYKKYPSSDEGIKNLLENTRMGIHSTILVKKGALSALPPEINETISKYGIKLIEITDHQLNSADTFVVHSVDKNLSLQFAHLELAVQEELTQGFISGSFMKTIDVLMLMKEFEKKGLTKGHYDKTTVKAVLNKVETHIQKEDGSYDETFGATCKALWLFLNFLGEDHELTRGAYSYIKKKDSVDTVREFLERHCVLSYFEPDRAAYLKRTCSDTINSIIDKRFGGISEYDFLIIFETAAAIGDEGQLMSLFTYIQENTDEDGRFFSSYATSVITSYLIDVYDIIKNEGNKEALRRLLFGLVLYIRRISLSSLPIEEALRLACTLYKFETVVSFPIGDLTEIIFKTGSFPHEYKKMERKISRYQDTRVEIDNAKDENEKLTKENEKLKKENRRIPLFSALLLVLFTLFVISAYACVYLGILLANSDIKVMSALIDKIKESWPSLFTLLIIPLVSFIVKKYFFKKGD